jgi:hypothetical protein
MFSNLNLLCSNLCLWLLLVNPLSSVYAKTTTADFILSGLHTEYVLGSFAVAEGQMGYMKVTLQSKDPYQMNKDLNVRLIYDENWKKFDKAASCTEKIPFSAINEHVSQQRKHHNYEAEIAMPLDNKNGNRPKYFYFVITDCSLEFYMHDDRIPKVHYKLETWNDGSHVSADESHLRKLHTLTLVISGVLTALLAMAIMIQLYEKSSAHISVFWVMSAAFSDFLSSLFELIHLKLYAGNGVGSYFLDALSAHLEAICDSLIMLLLLSIAVGWTLPSDVVGVQQNASMVQKIMGGLQSPFKALTSFSSTSMLAIGIIVLHVVLAQWGRIYNDDFDSYHDLEHLPGKLLMVTRIMMGTVFLGSCFQTKFRCPISLQGFYLKLAFVGGAWFLSLPVLTWLVNTMVSYHLRHFSVGIWGAACQSSSIVLLSWLVTSHSTAYHKFSHMSGTTNSLTDSLSSGMSPKAGGETKEWTIMGKAKVRLD